MALHSRPLMTRIAIVGAGVIGLAAAYELRRRGHEVSVIDRGLPGDGCSRGNAGWICPSFSSPLPAPGLGLQSLTWMLRGDSPLHISLRAMPRMAAWLWRFWRHCNPRDYARGLEALAALNANTVRAFDDWAADGITFEMHKSGIVWAFLDPRKARAATSDFIALAKFGYATPELLNGDALRELEPALSDRVSAGFLVEQECFVRPESLTSGLVTRLEELGVMIHGETEVLRSQSHGSQLRTLVTSDHDVQADVFVIAAGAWSGRLAAMIGSPLPVQAGKGYSVTLPASTMSLARALYLAEARAAVTPFDGSVRVAGTMELSGLNTRMDHRRVAAIKRSTDAFCRARPKWTDGEAWVGARPITPDGLPIIGRLPGVDNVFVATGHGMLGITLAPATAHLVADLVQGRANPDLVRPFDAARFA